MQRELRVSSNTCTLLFLLSVSRSHSHQAPPRPHPLSFSSLIPFSLPLSFSLSLPLSLSLSLTLTLATLALALSLSQPPCQPVHARVNQQTLDPGDELLSYKSIALGFGSSQLCLQYAANSWCLLGSASVRARSPASSSHTHLIQ